MKFEVVPNEENLSLCIVEFKRDDPPPYITTNLNSNSFPLNEKEPSAPN